MIQPKVVMLLSNSYRPDNRVQREARSLHQFGYSVKVIAWDRQAEFTTLEEDNGVEILRIQHIPSVYYGGLRQALVLPLFWDAAVKEAMKEKLDIIHCHDLDTLFAGVRVKLHTGCSLVFDAHENYPAMMSLYLPGFFVHWLKRLERQLIRRSDLILTASQVLADLYLTQGYEPVTVIPNTSDLVSFNRLEKTQISQKRQELGIRDSDLCVAYIGGFTRNRLILPLIKAVNGLDNVHLLIWGDGIQRPELEQAIQASPQARYMGWLPQDQLPLMMSAVDVIYYALQPDYPGAAFNAPNALSNAMAAGKPIIANRVGDLGNIIEQENCGVLLDEVTPQSIKKVLQGLLSDPERRRVLGLSGRAAAERKYQWANSAKYLIEAYSNMLRLRSEE